MFITYNQDGKVTAYSDNPRNVHDFEEGETEVEVDMEFNHVDCVEGKLIYEDGKLVNDGIVIAEKVAEPTPIPVES